MTVDVWDDYPLLGALYTGVVVSREAVGEAMKAVEEIGALRAQVDRLQSLFDRKPS